MLSPDFSQIMLAYFFATISPGADLAMVMRQGLVHGRRHAMMTGLGTGAAVFVHITYTIFGLGLLIIKSPFLFNVLKWAGVFYLLYIGISSIISRSHPAVSLEPSEEVDAKRQSYTKAFFLGLSVDLLNPQAVFFFLSIFSTLVAYNTPFSVKMGYGVLMAIIVVAWFFLVSYLIASESLRERFLRFSRWIDWISGLFFVFLALQLMLTTKLQIP